MNWKLKNNGLVGNNGVNARPVGLRNAYFGDGLCGFGAFNFFSVPFRCFFGCDIKLNQ